MSSVTSPQLHDCSLWIHEVWGESEEEQVTIKIPECGTYFYRWQRQVDLCEFQASQSHIHSKTLSQKQTKDARMLIPIRLASREYQY